MHNDESVRVDAATAGSAFAEPVDMHGECARTYVPIAFRVRRGRIDGQTRRRLACDLRAHGHAVRAIAVALGVTPRTVLADLAA